MTSEPVVQVRDLVNELGGNRLHDHIDLDLRRGERERLDEALGAQSVAGDEGQRHGPALGVLGQRAGKFRQHEGVVTFGRAGERDRAALAEPQRQGESWRHENGRSATIASRGALRSRSNSGVA